ncbi:MAG: hypothetical protein M0Z55_08885 [Peptococcaceae bacterium]|nr:hypothetical protein [Peptococcaceae bacterium]
MSTSRGVSNGSTRTRRRIRPGFTKKIDNKVTHFANAILLEAYSPEKDPAVKRLRQRLEKLGS